MSKHFISVMLLCASFRCTGSPGFPAVEYIQAIRTSLNNCTMSYTMECEYPDGQKLSVKGQSGVQGNKYFDSSNVRFVLFNERWEIAADHIQKVLSVANVTTLNKQFRGVAEVSASSFLFGPDFIAENINLSKIREREDTVWFKVDMHQQEIIRDFTVCMSKSRARLLSYDIMLDCPLSVYTRMEDLEGSVKVKLHAGHITYPAPAWMFDSDRIVRERGKKASLKRFGDYKTFLANPQKNEK